MKVVLMVLNSFTNDSRVLKEAITLKRSGYEVQVVALHEGKLKEYDLIEGIPVHRIKLKTRKLPKNFLFQLLKYVELAVKVIKNYRKNNFFHANDLSPLPIAVLIKKFFNKEMKIIYDAHEYESERNGLKGFRKQMVKFTELISIKHADSVITVSDSIAREYVRLYDIPKPYVVLNCPNYRQHKKFNLFRETFGISKNTPVFLYQGGLTKGRKIEEYLKIFSKTSDIALVIMGFGPLTGLVKTYANKYENIFYHNAVSPEILLKYTSSADIGLCYIENTCLSYYYSLPNKFFEYMMAGLPILTNNLPELKEKVENYKVGWVCDDLTEDFLKNLAKDVDTNTILYTKNTEKMSKVYCWEEQEKILINAYRNVIK